MAALLVHIGNLLYWNNTLPHSLRLCQHVCRKRTLLHYKSTGEVEVLEWLRKVITVTSWLARWNLKSPASRLFSQPFAWRRSTKTSKLHVTGRKPPVSSRWIPPKGKWRERCFHLMTSSCIWILEYQTQQVVNSGPYACATLYRRLPDTDPLNSGSGVGDY